LSPLRPSDDPEEDGAASSHVSLVRDHVISAPTISIHGPEGIGAKRYQIGANWPRVRGYEVLSLIGSGGMATVFKARHRDLRRTVALKTIRPSVLSDPGFPERFYAEAEAVARLQHPNIIQVFEIGTLEPQPGCPEPGPFIALEYVDGGSLFDRVDHPQPPRAAAEMLEKLARAAHAAHRVGVIHRDLKPANVLLTKSGEPKIADFGVAKQLTAQPEDSPRCQTRAGTAMGTPEYMAPEQANGEAPTPAMDVYALGVILYELLTARVPHQAASAFETLDLVRNQDPIHPRRLQPRLPRDLETICLKCLEKDPAHRYASAEGLADDLRRFLDDRPVLARRTGSAEKLGRWCKRNPLPAASLAAAVAVFLTAFGLVTRSYWQSEQARAQLAEQRDQAQRREKAERWERYRADIVASANALQVYHADSARRTLASSPVEHRNWEWRYFNGRVDSARLVLTGFPAGGSGVGGASADGRRVMLNAGSRARVWDTTGPRALLAVDGPDDSGYFCLSPDGRTLAYRSGETDVVLVDVDTNEVRAVLRGHERIIRDVHFYEDGKFLTTGSHEQPFRVWDVSTGSLVRTIRTEFEKHYSVSFSGDGRRMTYANPDDREVRVIDVTTDQRIATVPNVSKAGLQAVDLDRAGRTFVTRELYPSNTLRVWDADTGQAICSMSGHSNSVTQFARSPDGRRIASASRDQTIGLWDAATGRSIAVLRGHLGVVNAVAFSPDGARLLSGSEDHTVRLWDGRTGEALSVLPGHTDGVFRVSYAADGGTILSFGRDGTVRVWDARTAELNHTLRGHTTFVYGVAFHPDGERVASASWDGTARVWDATTGRQSAVLNHGDKTVATAVAFHPAGKLLATRARDAVRLWDVETGREVHRWDVPGDGWRDSRLAFSPDGHRLAAGCAGPVIRVWDTDTRTELATLRGHEVEVRDVAFSPDGRWLASAGDGPVRIWDVTRGELVQTLAGHTAGAYAAAFNRQGTQLATGSTDGTVRLWDVTTWTETAVLKHGTNVYGVAFSPDGTRLVSACADNSIRFWDLATRQEVADLRGHGAYVHQIAFSPDGSRLVSGSGDHTLRIWDSRSAQERLSRPAARSE
jgi:WD40 repeat protein